MARAFETSRRRDTLLFTHNREVAALPPPEADELLDTAEAEGWSTRDLRAEVSRRHLNASQRAMKLSRRELVNPRPAGRGGGHIGSIYLKAYQLINFIYIPDSARSSG